MKDIGRLVGNIGPFGSVLALTEYFSIRTGGKLKWPESFLIWTACFRIVAEATVVSISQVKDHGHFKMHPIIFEPTCACCTVGSYASLSVCLSVCHVTISLDNNSYLRKKNSCQQMKYCSDRYGSLPTSSCIFNLLYQKFFTQSRKQIWQSGSIFMFLCDTSYWTSRLG